MTILNRDHLDRFIADGYLYLAGAFPRELAQECVDALWPATGVDPDRPETWTAPVVRVSGSVAPPLVDAINSSRLVGALDDLLGPGRWQRRTGYGTFPIRFPSEVDPGDTGGHVDGSYARRHGTIPSSTPQALPATSTSAIRSSSTPPPGPIAEPALASSVNHRSTTPPATTASTTSAPTHPPSRSRSDKPSIPTTDGEETHP